MPHPSVIEDYITAANELTFLQLLHHPYGEYIMVYTAWISNYKLNPTDVDTLYELYNEEHPLEDDEIRPFLNRHPFESGVGHVSFGVDSSRIGAGNIEFVNGSTGWIGLEFSGSARGFIPRFQDFVTILLKLLEDTKYTPLQLKLDLVKALITDDCDYIELDELDFFVAILNRFKVFMVSNKLSMTYVDYPATNAVINELTNYSHCVFLVKTK